MVWLNHFLKYYSNVKVWVNNIIMAGLSAPDWMVVWFSYAMSALCVITVFSLARSFVDESAESPGDHRGQPSEAIWKLAAQGEWIYMNQPPLILLYIPIMSQWAHTLTHTTVNDVDMDHKMNCSSLQGWTSSLYYFRMGYWFQSCCLWVSITLRPPVSTLICLGATNKLEYMKPYIRPWELVAHYWLVRSCKEHPASRMVTAHDAT